MKQRIIGKAFDKKYALRVAKYNKVFQDLKALIGREHFLYRKCTKLLEKQDNIEKKIVFLKKQVTQYHRFVDLLRDQNRVTMAELKEYFPKIEEVKDEKN